MEVFCLTAQKKPVMITVLGWLSLLLAILCMVLSCGIGSIFPMIGVILFGVLFWYLVFRSDLEYECSYFDGEVRFARIRAKSSRKSLKSYSMDEVIQIAPAGDRSVYKYENDKQLKVCDYTSKKTGTPYYVMVVKPTEGEQVLYKVELDKEYLDAVCIKYSYKVIRRKENV